MRLPSGATAKFIKLPPICFSDNIRGLFYKGESQEKHFTGDRSFSCFPARVMEQEVFRASAP
jgi:hypothetical protein